jgi:hypothetical protein
MPAEGAMQIEAEAPLTGAREVGAAGVELEGVDAAYGAVAAFAA